MSFQRDPHRGRVERPSLGEYLYEKMRMDLREGRWVESLPGVRGLMAAYGVSRPPLDEALTKLEREGWISGARPGRTREIPKRPEQKEKGLLLVRPAEPGMTWLTKEVYRGLRRGMEEMGCGFREVEEDRVESLKGERGWRGVIGLDVAHERLRQAIGGEPPMLLMGSLRFDDPRTAAVSVSIPRLLEEAIPYLKRQGVKRLLVVSLGLPQATYRDLVARVGGIFRGCGMSFSEAENFPWMSRGNVGRELRHGLADGRARVVLTIQEAAWARTMWEARGRPNVEVLALWESPVFEGFDVAPALGRVRVEDFFGAFRKWEMGLRRGKAMRFRQPVRVQTVWRRNAKESFE